MALVDTLFGRRLASAEAEGRRIGWFEAVPAMGLDALGSASYGPEAALTILMPLGAGGPGWSLAVMAPVVLLLAVLYASYRQTVAAYPGNGGGYTVARENLGRAASLLAAASLMVDYVLNVAVGISAGVGALTSALPALAPWTLPLCLGILAMVTLANLRGTPEAGWLFSVPTYVFIASFLGIVGLGLVRIVVAGGAPPPVLAPPALHAATAAMAPWLFLRAFASGCTAMTGVEAVSNGVGALRGPGAREARRTLAVICLVLGLLLAGIAAAASGYGIGAMDQSRPGYRSVLSQLAAAVVGRGAVYDVAMASLLAVLCLSANTSFVGFPRLCRVVAADGFLPRAFAMADRRLVFSAGVLVLAGLSGGLLAGFGGITDRLIPLFAVGAFATFAISQAGMVVHWHRAGGRNALPLVINAVGAAATIAALAVILLAKFAAGAWITVIAIPAIIAGLRAIRLAYDRDDARLAPEAAFRIDETAPPTVLVAFAGRNRMTDSALGFAMTLSPDVIAVHLLRLAGPEEAEDGAAIRRRWEAEVVAPLVARGIAPPRLMLLPARYREMHEPLLELVGKLDAATPGRSVAVLIPGVARRHWWEHALHGTRADRLRRMLLRHGDARVRVILAPWRS